MLDLLCSAGQDRCNLWRCWHRNMFSGASSGGAALPGIGTLWRCACLFLPPLCVRAGAHFGEGPWGSVCTVASLSEQAGGLLLGWGCRCAPLLPQHPRGRHAARRQEQLKLGCAPQHGDAAIVWCASGAWWDVQPDLWYCCETGMLLAMLGWQKHLGAASCGMG